ncbi:MAG: DUF2948 family protein [Pseudomonadota bacterium]
MDQDARFEDGGEEPLRLMAATAEDLDVISMLLQDAVFQVSGLSFRRGARQFALLLNRFRWEDVPAAERLHRDYERVQAVLAFEDVLGVASQGIEKSKADVVMSLLRLDFNPGQDGGGHIEIILAGNGAFRLQVEAINVTLKDVTRPYIAPSRKMPKHELD